jgi:putative FmdB family regulatory protein
MGGALEAAWYNRVLTPARGAWTVPLYEYQCTKCRKKTEKIESVSGPHLKKCPHCDGKVERLMAAPAIQFKGAGWYVTDYAGKKSGGTDGGAPEKSTANVNAKESAAKETAPQAPKEEKNTPKKE